MRAELYWVESPFPGRLAIGPRPRGGAWLDDELSDFRRVGVEVVVSLLTASEVRELDLMEEGAGCRTTGIEFLNFPIPDRDVPASRAAFMAFARDVHGRISAGRSVLCHCRAGIGRSSMMAVAVLALGGVPVADAFVRVIRARGREVPDTPEQRAWIEDTF
jgi:protein-tyrosine phosphatase